MQDIRTLRNVQAWYLVLGLLTVSRCDDSSTAAPAPSSSIITADPVEVPVDPSATNGVPQVPPSALAPKRPVDSTCRCPPDDPLCTCL